MHPPTPATGKLIHDLLCDGETAVREGGTFGETETRNAICLAFLNACDSAVAPMDDLAQLAELDLNAQRRDH